MEAIILAGGLGTRLRSIIPGLPKPMAPVNGRPFLEHQIGYWLKQGVHRFVLSVGYKHDKIRAHFGDSYKDAEIVYAIEKEPLGTGGGLLLAIDYLKSKSPFLVLNGDTYFETGLNVLKNFHLEHNAEITIALFSTDTKNRYMGVKLAKDAKIVAFKANASLQGQLVNGGVYLAERNAFKQCGWRPGDKLSLEDDLFPSLLLKGKKLYGFITKGRFIDIGVPKDLVQAETVLSA